MAKYRITVNVAKRFISDSRKLAFGAYSTFKAYPIEITVQQNLATAVVLPHRKTTGLKSIIARRIAKITSSFFPGTITQPGAAIPTIEGELTTVPVYSYVLFDSCEDGVPRSSARLSLLCDIASELSSDDNTIVLDCDSWPTDEEVNLALAEKIKSLDAYQSYIMVYFCCDCDLYAHKDNPNSNDAPVFKNENISILNECDQDNLLGQTVCKQCCQELSDCVSGLFNLRHKSRERVYDGTPLLLDSNRISYSNGNDKY